MGGEGGFVARAYSKSFKEKVVKRLLEPEVIIAEVERWSGVSDTTLSRWRAEALSLPMMASSKKTGRGRRRWTAVEKAQILARASELEGEQLGAYLREQGVHPTQLEAWRKALDEHVETNRQASRRIQQLERELARKDKALAETAALLVLKKKWLPSTGARTTTRTGRAAADARSHRGGGAKRPFAGAGVRRDRSAATHRAALASPRWRR